MERHIALGFVLGVICSACGGSSSSTTAPTPLAPLKFSLGGIITDAAGAPLRDTIVRIDSGPELGATSASDASGHYLIINLTPGTVVVSAAPVTTYRPMSKTIELSSNAVVDFSLAKIQRAELQTEDTFKYTLQPNRQEWSVLATARNVGDGCAGNISGSVELVDKNGVKVGTSEWAARTDLVVRPGQSFTFDFCCIPISVTDGTAVMSYNFATVDPCP